MQHQAFLRAESVFPLAWLLCQPPVILTVTCFWGLLSDEYCRAALDGHLVQLLSQPMVCAQAGLKQCH